MEQFTPTVTILLSEYDELKKNGYNWLAHRELAHNDLQQSTILNETCQLIISKYHILGDPVYRMNYRYLGDYIASVLTYLDARGDAHEKSAREMFKHINQLGDRPSIELAVKYDKAYGKTK